MARNQHVTPHPNGGWQVKVAGSKKYILEHKVMACKKIKKESQTLMCIQLSC